MLRATRPMRHNYWSPHSLEPVLCKRRSYCNAKPTHSCSLQREKVCTATKTQHSQKDINWLNFLKKLKKKNIAQKIINSKEHHKISAEFFSKKCISTLLNINHRIYKDSRILQPEYKYRKHDSLLQQNLNFSCYRLTITIRKTMSIYIKIDQLDSYPEVCLNNLSKKILTHYWIHVIKDKPLFVLWDSAQLDKKPTRFAFPTWDLWLFKNWCLICATLSCLASVVYTQWRFCRWLQLCMFTPTQLLSYVWLLLKDPMDYSPPGSSVHGIILARILEWVAFSPPGQLPNAGIEPASLVSPALAGRFFITESPGKPWATREAQG